jgi:hypothetical protein
MAVFWVVAPCSLVEVYRRFRGAYCLHHQGDEYYLFKIRFNIILPSTCKSSKLYVPFTYSYQNSVRISHFSHAYYMLHPPHSYSFDHPNDMW